jgi:uncharacterized membrane protein YfcA
MHVSLLAYCVAATAVLVGSVVQGSTGMGLNMIAAPFVAIVVPDALPATLVLVALPLAVSTLVREHYALDRQALPWLLLGALPGTTLGLVIVRVADANALAIIVGATTLLGVILSVTSPPVPTNRVTSLVAGFASNLFGTASSVGGPPVALLFQHRTGPIARATLGAFFMTSALFSITGYVATDAISGDQVLFALALLPLMVAGLWCSRYLHRHVDGGWLRPAMLVLSTVAGTAAIVHGLA